MNLPAISTARLPDTYEAAKVALASCAQIDECQTWADKAAALASYARQSRDDELEKLAQRIRARAIRRAGELLKQIEPQQGQRNDIEPKVGGGPKSRTDAARDAGMSERQQKQAVRIANVPDEDFAEQVESQTPPTLSALAQQGITPRQVMEHSGVGPKAFNAALHLVGDARQYALDMGKKELGLCIDGLSQDQRTKLRGYIASIDAMHDNIMTRI